MTKEEVFVSVDVESSGPIPGEFSMLSLGACVVGNTDQNFYVEIKPLNINYKPKALKVCGLDFGKLVMEGVEAKEAMQRFYNWIKENFLDKNLRPVFVSFGEYDYMFVNWYFEKFLGHNPFSFNGLDIKSFAMGVLGCTWTGTSKRNIPSEFHSGLPHTHNALDDAKKQAELFLRLLEYRKAGL